MRSKLVAGNWKMNGNRTMARALAQDILSGVGDLHCEFLLCPPFTLLSEVSAQVSGSKVALGGQDCHAAASGAHTGDISAGMLSEVGCEYAIVGHSERRSDHGEVDSVVREKAEAVHASGLIAIVCVGESEAQRDAGIALEAVGAQIRNSLPAAATASNTVVAYEPVWAIGTGRTPTIEQIADMHVHMRGVVADLLSAAIADEMKLLYGGSVNADNAAGILAAEGVDGALVGGASLKADSFLAIGRSCY